MNTTPTTKSVLTALNLIYFSLVSVMASFGLIVLYLNYSESLSTDADPEFTLLLRYVLFALLPIGIGAGYFIFKQTLAPINSSMTLKEKLFKYQTALLIRSACFELPGLMGSVAALITGENSFLLFTAIVVVLFLLVRPTLYTLTSDLNLSAIERSILENPSAPLN
jgi:hypothetical protein